MISKHVKVFEEFIETLNSEEKQLLEFPIILDKWFQTGTPDIKQFTHKYRGKLFGHKFEF